MLHTPALEALFAFLQSGHRHTDTILQGDELPVINLELCMQLLEGQPAAQMTAGACLCKLVFLELQGKADPGTAYAYREQLISRKGFKAMMRCLEAGIQVCPCACCSATRS